MASTEHIEDILNSLHKRLSLLEARVPPFQDRAYQERGIFDPDFESTATIVDRKLTQLKKRHSQQKSQGIGWVLRDSDHVTYEIDGVQRTYTDALFGAKSRNRFTITYIPQDLQYKVQFDHLPNALFFNSEDQVFQYLDRYQPI